MRMTDDQRDSVARAMEALAIQPGKVEECGSCQAGYPANPPTYNPGRDTPPEHRFWWHDVEGSGPYVCRRDRPRADSATSWDQLNIGQADAPSFSRLRGLKPEATRDVCPCGDWYCNGNHSNPPEPLSAPSWLPGTGPAVAEALKLQAHNEAVLHKARRERIAMTVLGGLAANPGSPMDAPMRWASWAFIWADAFMAEADKAAR